MKINKILKEYDTIARVYTVYQRSFKEEHNPAIELFKGMDLQLKNYETLYVDTQILRAYATKRFDIKD